MNIISYAVLFWLSLLVRSDGQLTCKDYEGKAIEHGEEFMPDPNDRCKTCTCNQGFPTMCRLVSCSPPSCPNWYQDKTECCKFTCLETTPTDLPADNSTDNTVTSADSLTTLGLRLVASTVTSFLVLALLLFAVHQLRRKRLILAMRRYSDNRRRHDTDMYTPDYFGMACPPYEEPPPPYSPPKPPDDTHPDDAPPPYESVDSNHNVSSRVFPEPSVICATSPRDERNQNSSERSVFHTASPVRNNSCNRSSDVNRQSSTRTLLSNCQSSPDTLPAWNSFTHPRGGNLPSNNRHLERCISDNSDIESDRASTDFGLTSDSEAHYSRCGPRENIDLRHVRLSKLLSPNGSVAKENGAYSDLPGRGTLSGNLESDAQYPDHNLSHAHCNTLPSVHNDVSMKGISGSGDKVINNKETESPSWSQSLADSNEEPEGQHCSVV
ncbi:integral membrane protein DGCR2/IDD-like isoform X1 [Mytilus trossulus]|uniref:integral membrane protein DGCR2/IDD-like isoform X1 n=1 Tax=Mytilus trossulus TaxID=6551 RepID=UPI0030054F91